MKRMKAVEPVLPQAVALIKQWYCKGLGKSADEAWRLYCLNADEMKPIIEALIEAGEVEVKE